MLKLAISLVVGGALAITLPTYALEQPEPPIIPPAVLKPPKAIELAETVKDTPEPEKPLTVPSTLPTEPIVTNVGDDNTVSSVESIDATKQAWMSAAGIPEAEWWAVDWLVSREASWNPEAINPSSGACGLAQSLPCSKIADTGRVWNDPVDALSWQYEYVNSRYGGYAGAVAFWQVNSWY